MRRHGSLYDLDTEVTINFTTGRVRDDDEDEARFVDRLEEDEVSLAFLRASNPSRSAASLVVALSFSALPISSLRIASVVNISPLLSSWLLSSSDIVLCRLCRIMAMVLETIRALAQKQSVKLFFQMKIWNECT